MPLRLPTAQDLRALRLRLGLTQAEVARAAGVSQPLVARVESGSVDPRFSTLRAIVEALNRAEREEVRLRALMTHPVEVVRATDTVAEAIRLMRQGNYSQLPVVQKGLPVGSVSEKAVVHAISEAGDVQAVSRSPVRDVMGAPFPTGAPDMSVDQAFGLLEDHPAVLVMDRGRIVGIVSKSDLLNLIK